MEKIADVIAAIEAVAPLDLQEDWDNSGFQVGDPHALTDGVLICLDVTPEILQEAHTKGCSLVISHHPLLFHPTRQLLGRDRAERCVALAFRLGITVYSAHTSCDCAPRGVSYQMALDLDLHDIQTLDPASGLGTIGQLPQPLSYDQLLQKVKTTFGCQALRVSRTPRLTEYQRIALCGGAGADLIVNAIAQGAQAYITADCKHNFFLDYRDDILLIDAGHFETEQCARAIFSRALTSRFPKLPVYISEVELPPILFQ